MDINRQTDKIFNNHSLTNNNSINRQADKILNSHNLINNNSCRPQHIHRASRTSNSSLQTTLSTFLIDKYIYMLLLTIKLYHCPFGRSSLKKKTTQIAPSKHSKPVKPIAIECSTISIVKVQVCRDMKQQLKKIEKALIKIMKRVLP